MISNAVAVGIGTVTAACAESVTRNMLQAIERRNAKLSNPGAAQAESSGVSILKIYLVIFVIVCHLFDTKNRNPDLN